MSVIDYYYFYPAEYWSQSIGGIAPNQVIARSEFEVHHHIYTE